jgi:hypothetical protein
MRITTLPLPIQQGACGVTRVVGVAPSLRAPLLRPPKGPFIIGGQLLGASIGQRSLGLRSEAGSRGAAAAKTNHMYRISRSTRNDALKYSKLSVLAFRTIED